jgi:hypothetical protein
MYKRYKEMSSTYDRVFKHITNTKEPKGHCEAVKHRHDNNLAIADRTFKRKLRVTK